MIIPETIVTGGDCWQSLKDRDNEPEDTTGSQEEIEMCTDTETDGNPEGSQTTNDQECDELRQNTTIRPLPPKQIQALELLAVGYSVTQVAEDVGVHRSTIHCWKNNNPEFSKQLALFEKEIVQEIRLRSLGIVTAGLAVLEEIFQEEDNSRTKFEALKLVGIGALMKHSLSTTREDD